MLIGSRWCSGEKKNAGNFHFGKGTEWKVTKLFGAFVAVNTHRVSELFI